MYMTLIREALEAARPYQQNGEWNTRFRAALAENGLKLAPRNSVKKRDTRYPDGSPYRAPPSQAGTDDWPEATVIVFDDTV